MILDCKNPSDDGPCLRTHAVSCASTGEDLSSLGFFYADDHAGLLKVHLRDELGRKFMRDPATGHRYKFPGWSTKDADGNTLYDYGDGYLSPREPQIATAEIRRPIRIVARVPVAHCS